jgi:hypothetical protein
MATSEDGIVEDAEDAEDQRDRQDASTEPAKRQRPSSHRTVVSQVTQVRMVYRHTLTLECGHTEHRTGGRTGGVSRRVKCTACAASCAASAPIVEEPRKNLLGMLEKLILGRS